MKRREIGTLIDGCPQFLSLIDGCPQFLATKLTDLVPPVNGVVVGRGPNGQKLTDALIREGASRAKSRLVDARRSGIGRGSTIGTAVIIDKHGVRFTTPNTRTTDGLVPLESGGGFGATSAASVGADFLVILLQDGVDNSPSSRAAQSHLNDALNASLVDDAGLPVILIAPSGAGNTGLMLEAILNSRVGIDATVDEVIVR